MISSDDIGASGAFNLVVGGFYYSLHRSDVEAHPNCYFASAIKDVWNNSQQPIVIDRDGTLFKHIYVYLYHHSNCLPFVATGSLELLVSVRREADYYNLPELVALYDKACQVEMSNWWMSQSLSASSAWHTMALQSKMVCELEELINFAVYPSCHTGTIDPAYCKPRLCETVDLVSLKLNSSLISSNDSNNGAKCAKNLFQVNNSSVTNLCLLKDLREFLPVMPGVECLLTNGGVFICTEDGYVKHEGVGARCTSRIGTLFFILNSAHIGGTITVTRNGYSKSIAKPGEYIMCTGEYSRNISVKTGALVFAKFSIVRKDTKRDLYSGRIRSATLVPYNTLPSQSALVDAVSGELTLAGSSVVICLSTLYPIVEFDPSGPYLETDPDALTDRDAVLYEYLKGNFDVTLLTVCVQRIGDASKGYIIGPVATTLTEKNTKIIAPFHNYRESFVVDNNSSQAFATLYTAMYITTK